MGSENLTGGDDQQETAQEPLDPYWITGFVDGEGCFSVSFHKNPYVRKTRGWQIMPVFQVYQHERYTETLEAIAGYFGCGYLRPKGPNSDVLTYAVQARRDLLGRVIPFFEQYPLRIKQRDFETFARITRALDEKEHLRPEGFERVARLAYSMNAHGKQRTRTLEQILAGSSETERQARFDLGNEAAGSYSPNLMATWGVRQQ